MTQSISSQLKTHLLQRQVKTTQSSLLQKTSSLKFKAWNRPYKVFNQLKARQPI